MDSAAADLLADPVAAQQTAAVFQRLKPISSQLLYLRNEPQQLQQALKVLQNVITDLPPQGLTRCFDYVTYPLLFMVDSIAVTRAPAAATSNSSSSSGGVTIAVPAMKNDRAGESVLDCLLVLLERVATRLESDQVLLLLQRLAAVLQLNQQQACEEIRLKVLKILTTLLQPPQQQQQQQWVKSRPLSQSATAPLAGMLISQCLAAAAAEASAGSSGSRVVRVAAVRALQAVVGAVGPGPQLAFFLPGLASGITKQLLAAVPATAGVPVTGAAAGSSGAVLLLQLLTQVIQMTLGDDVIQHVPDTNQQQQQQQLEGVVAGGSSSSKVSNAAEALQLLEQLSLQAAAGPQQQQQQQCIEPSSAPYPEQQQQQQGRSANFTVELNADWLSNSSSKIQTMIAMTLPRLLTHPQPAVRAAVAAAAASLLQQCSRAMHNSRQALLEILLTLASDEYIQVSSVAVGCLQQTGAAVQLGSSSSSTGSAEAAGSQTSAAAAAAKPLSKSAAAGRIAAAARAALSGQASPQAASADHITAASSSSSSGGSSSGFSDLVVRLCCELPAAARRGDAAGTAAAKRAAAALLCAGPSILQDDIFSKPRVISNVCDALVATFQLDPSTAALLLRATPAAAAPGGHTATAAAAVVNGRPTTALNGTLDGNNDVSSGSSSTAGAPTSAAAAAAGADLAGWPLLPRMPLSLKYLISHESYLAAAAAARALGRCARILDLQKQATTGASALQLLVDHLLAELHTAAAPHNNQQQQNQPGSSSSTSRKRSSFTPAAGEWQCQTAAVAVVITEITFGASAAWQPPIKQISKTEAAATAGSSDQLKQQQQQTQDDLSMVDSSYDSVLSTVITAVTAPKLWGLPTSNAETLHTAAAAAAAGQTQQLPAQVLGANALLLRTLIDCIGTAARSAGPHFSSSTKLIRAVLLPLLERLADPCPLVAAAASGALNSICRHAGYPQGLGQLVSANADYIIDGVCKRLRNLGSSPRAPQLLAALLRQAGVGSQLIPLLAEPLRAALSGVSILARKQQPGYILPFLHVLQSVAAGAALEAAATQTIFRMQLADLLAAATAARLFDTESDSYDDEYNIPEEGTGSGADAGGHSAAAAAGSAAARYFKQRLQQKANETSAESLQPQQQQQQLQQGAGSSSTPQAAATDEPALEAAAAAAAGDHLDLDQIPALPPGKKITLHPVQAESLELAWRRAYSAASLASSAVDAATPLLLQRNLRTAVLAVSVLAAALKALAAATDALDTEERMYELLVEKPPDSALKPARPEAVKLLPAVHSIWPPLLACLHDTGSVALLEQGMSLLSQMVKLAGGRFMARRFKQEAWPLLVRLLQQGPQSGASALAAATASSTGGGAAAAALLGVGGGPGSEGVGSSTSRSALLGPSSSSSSGGQGIMQSALRTLGAAAGSSSSSWNAAQGSMVSSESYLQETDSSATLAPATLQRVRLAVMTCLQEICSDSAASFAVQGTLVWDISMLAAPYLADSQLLGLREAAVKLLAAAAQVDADTVWLVLVDLASCCQDVSQLLPVPGLCSQGVSSRQKAGSHGEASLNLKPVQDAANAAGEVLQAAASGSELEQAQLPKLRQLLPHVSAAAGAAGSERGGLQKLLRSNEGVSCGKRAAGLLQRLEKQEIEIDWHAKAKQQLVQLRSAKVL